MFLKTLTLKGFKSFADATTIELEPGITVVVGPNGSGKSNVVDAVAWVLGAQGPRTVRSTKMDDVIFAGSPERPALGRAEVSLVIDNSAGRIPVPMSEITVTRTLFRSGESEYAINKAPCRLLDVQELLSEAGVGRQQHVIVGQGQLDSVLNARPEDRRLMIEEAAGVLKYRRRRERAERRLEATEGSLVRLQDLLREVRRQLRPLERQAEVAQRQDEVASELRALKLHLAGRDVAGLSRDLRASAEARATLARQEESLRESLARLDAEVTHEEADLDASRAADLGALLARAEGLRERARGIAGVIAERRRSLERSRSSVINEDLVAALLEERSDLAVQLESVEAELSSLAPANEEAGAPGERGEGETLECELRDVREQLAAVTRGLERDGAEAASLEERIASLGRKAEALAQELAHQTSELQRRRQHAELLGASVREASEAVLDAEARSEAAEAELLSAERDSHTWSARAAALRQAQEEARPDAGIEQLEGVAGVIGQFADLVRVEGGWEAAFEAVADDVMSAVVTADEDGARAALARFESDGTSGLVVSAALRGERRSEPPVPLGGEPLRAHVRGEGPAVDAVLDELLSGVVVVADGWEAAADMYLANRDLTVVTTSGDRFCSRGWRPGRLWRDGGAQALDEALRRAESSSAYVSVASERRDRARARLQRARAELSDRSREAERHDASTEAIEELMRRAGRDRDEVTRDLTGASERREDLERAMDEKRKLCRELGESVAELESRRERAVARAAEDALRRKAQEVKSAGLGERAAMLRGRLEGIERKLAESDPREQERRVADAGKVAGVLERLGVVVEECRAAVDWQLEDLERKRQEQAEATRGHLDRLNALRRQRGETEREVGLVRERSQRAEIEEAELRLRLETTCDSVRSELECEPEAAIGAPMPELPPGTSPESRKRELERELRIIGPVNALAREELSALSERHDLLQGQLEDVRSARRELGKVIRAVDTEIVEIFAAAYADVAENFSALFATLFPGGHGQLRLSDPTDLLNTGIEVEARPAGRAVKKLSLLSGGERSLAALAFLFAIFRSRPSPFYILDEVEAALDDVNLAKFLDLLEEFRDEAQLIIVSHQKHTMKAADSLYGVSMQQGGSSRVVSERMRQAELA